MRPRLRHLRELLRSDTPDPDEPDPARAARCMEAMESLCDPQGARGHGLGEREEAELEAERRRWAQPGSAPH
jgi:hypothetical protein